MCIAIISDIHGNALALDTLLADLQRASYDPAFPSTYRRYSIFISAAGSPMPTMQSLSMALK